MTKFDELVAAVAEIDEAAAAYIRIYYEFPNAKHPGLGGAFAWHSTPQGFAFWDNISNQLPEEFQ